MTLPNGYIKVLDKGYVGLVDSMGDDLRVAEAARVSFNKKPLVFSEKEEKLIKFLGNRKEYSPFRHVMFTLEIRAPLMVARQWMKYVVGSDHTMDGINESSRRYITEEPSFYIPDEWRSAPENKKQGSGENLDHDTCFALTQYLLDYVKEGERLYNQALSLNVAPEQARLFLPSYGMYVNWYWTCSLQSAAWFLHQRLEEKAQSEIREYAKAVLQLIEPIVPVSIKEILEGDK